MEKRVLILTGIPGVGKTTVLAKTVSSLRGRGVSVGGMFSREVREDGIRVGFEVVDVARAKVGWLAHVDQHGPQVGKYHVNLGDLEAVGVQAINDATENRDVVVIDEIGPMELFSEKFKQAAQKALGSGKLVIAVVHWKAQDKLVVEAKSRPDAEVFTVTPQNWDGLQEELVEKAVEFLRRFLEPCGFDFAHCLEVGVV
ncbi:MAG: NTPase [Candidatus Bathyarchaeota archaeon]|nr:NTPase [Candidatus Bathyarchaeota archaeon]